MTNKLSLTPPIVHCCQYLISSNLYSRMTEIYVCYFFSEGSETEEKVKEKEDQTFDPEKDSKVGSKKWSSGNQPPNQNIC